MPGHPRPRERDEIVFFGDFVFPEGDAAAIRTLSLARICRDLGYLVTVVGKGRLRPEDRDAASGRHLIEGIAYTTMNPKPVLAIDRLRHPVRRLRQSSAALEELDSGRIRAVVINASGSARHVPFVRAFCRRRGIPLVADVCEWYDPRQMNYGRLDPAYAAFSFVFHSVLPRLRHLIVISRLLERHFEGAGRHVLRVPPVLDTHLIPCADLAPSDRLVLLYAGFPGRKDLLGEFLAALASLPPADRSRVEFRLLGPTRQELARLLGDAATLLDVLGDAVKPMGRVPRERVLDELQRAHFTLLLRPAERYANAGFPSKVPESLAAGTPVLLNFTSDLEKYLGDGSAVLPVHGRTKADVADALGRALALTPGELHQLRRGARAKAETCFDYRIFLESFGRYLDACAGD